MTGRPSDYSDELAATICERLTNGATLRQLCTAEGMPDRSTVYRWLEAHEDFRDRYARACELRADAWADELIEIADEAARDTKRNDRGEESADAEWISRSKLRVDARKWLMARAAPKKYGDKVLNEHTGADGGPVVTAIEFTIVDPKA